MGWQTEEDLDITIAAMVRGVLHEQDPVTWPHDSLVVLTAMVNGDRRDAGQSVARGAARAASARIAQFHEMEPFNLLHPNAVY